jgi:hypothetical protein
MASSAKKRTTMAKLNRENKLRARRQEKAARKEARKLDAADRAADDSVGPGTPSSGEGAGPGPRGS